MFDEGTKNLVRRRTLDQLRPLEGVRLRVFFPYGEGSRVLVASGETRKPSSDRSKSDHRMVDASGVGDSEWVPGWYVAAPAGVKKIV